MVGIWFIAFDAAQIGFGPFGVVGGFDPRLIGVGKVGPEERGGIELGTFEIGVFHLGKIQGSVFQTGPGKLAEFRSARFKSTSMRLD